MILKPSLFTKHKELSEFQSVNNPKRTTIKIDQKNDQDETLVKLADRIAELMDRNRPKLKRTFDHKIGIISDTHGLIRQSVVKSFKDVDLIVHAGDVRKPEVLIVKVHPVRGNVDEPVYIP